MLLVCLGILLSSSSGVRADLSVASLSTITTDLARNIGGDLVKVTAIIKPGIDPHAFDPAPSDVKSVAHADLVLYSGKGLEGFLTKLEEAAGGSGKFVNVGASIPSLTLTEEGSRVEDPHWWHSVENMKSAVRTVASAFERADPIHAPDYARNAEAYLASLEELNRWIRVKLAELPREKRKLVTSHDALQYFARDYGFSIYPVKGISTGEEPSSRHVRSVIELVRNERVKAVFFENIENPQAMRQISSDSGASEGGTLYTDGLGDREASTYDAMMRHNVTAIVEGLR